MDKPKCLADVQISRAKKCHAIVQGNSEPIYWSYEFVDMLEWCAAREINEMLIESEKGSYLIRFWSLPTKEEKDNG